ncbi:MAG: HAD family hydrolase [Myxococcales bacterium]|nr:HAD family hydrolase [Myxococcales bacterium]
MRVALFDMDRTLVRRDTATLWMRFRRDRGEASLRDMGRVAWWLFQYTLGVVDAPAVARKALADYRGTPEARMAELCRDWFTDYVLEHVAEEGRRAVARHREAGDGLAIVTGATRYAAEPLATELGIDKVAFTGLEVDAEGLFTGRVSGPMCYGADKITHVRKLFGPDLDLREAVFYSDSITDLPLLEAVGEPVVVNPDARLRRLALRRGWRVEQW